jgi:hypothetical protein
MRLIEWLSLIDGGWVWLTLPVLVVLVREDGREGVSDGEWFLNVTELCGH